jgi:hypothetical protein
VVWLLLVVLAAAGFAWLTRHPEAPIVERAQEWPVVGPLAEAFREAYLPPEPPPAESPPATGSEPTVEWILPDAGDLQARPFVWVRPGDRLHEAPDATSRVVQVITSIRNLYLLDRRGDWYRVRLARPDAPPIQAWVLLENYSEPSPEVLRQPDPVLPLPATPPRVERVEAARRGMGEGGRQLECGAYPLYTDVELGELVDLCARVTTDLEEVYRRRYGLKPVSPPAEAIFLFREEGAYRRFVELQRVPVDSRRAHAFPAEGYVALYLGDQSPVEVLSVLVHELTHLLNRRSLGPALPPWLAEGLADDLGESKIGEEGSLEPGRLGGEQTVAGAKTTRSGAVAAAIDLQRALEKDSLPGLEALLEFDRQRFRQPDRVQLHYALSSFWVRYLLSDFEAGLSAGFREFLRRVAAGEPITAQLLGESLDRDLASLEGGFRAWLRLQFLTPLDETLDESG